jgi:hypothetical protein
MAVFTYIATAIVTAYTGAAVVAGTWAAFAVSVIATGLAAITSRALGIGNKGGSGTQDQGVRIQLPPATENKIPIVYGTAYQQGVITDARISNSNQTMTYVLTLSEKTQTGNWSLGDVYWNDQRLVFKSASTGTVDYAVAQDGTNNTNLRDLVRVYVWAGGSSSTYQIYGPTPAINAYDVIPDTTSSYAMSDLVFAVVQLDYNSDKGVTGLPTMTFQLENSLKNPGLVWYDYMTASRYGAGFAASDVNTQTSISASTTGSLYNISNEIPANQFVRWPTYSSTGTQTTATSQVRYEINGVLNTGDTLKTNIEKINLASASFTTYDHKTGQWSVIPNRAISIQEQAQCYEFTDDNIIGDISLTATNLEDLFNQVESSFPNKVFRDQTDYFKYSLPSQDLNQLETVNQQRINVAMVNNYIHAGRIGQIELLQSRFDLVINFQSDYTALQVEAGDIIKVTNTTYGFDQKLFRVSRIRETEGEEGSLVSEITAIEYSTDIFTENTLTDLSLSIGTGIPSQIGSSGLPAPAVPITTNTQSSQFDLQTTIDATSYPVDAVQFAYSLNSMTGYINLSETVGVSVFTAGTTVNQTVSSNELGLGTYYFKARTRLGTNYSDYSSTSTSFYWDPVIDFGGGGGGGG